MGGLGIAGGSLKAELSLAWLQKWSTRSFRDAVWPQRLFWQAWLVASYLDLAFAMSDLEFTPDFSNLHGVELLSDIKVIIKEEREQDGEPQPKRTRRSYIAGQHADCIVVPAHRMLLWSLSKFFQAKVGAADFPYLALLGRLRDCNGTPLLWDLLWYIKLPLCCSTLDANGHGCHSDPEACHFVVMNTGFRMSAGRWEPYNITQHASMNV